MYKVYTGTKKSDGQSGRLRVGLYGSYTSSEDSVQNAQGHLFSRAIQTVFQEDGGTKGRSEGKWTVNKVTVVGGGEDRKGWIESNFKGRDDRA